MSLIKRILIIWLHLNLLTKDVDNDYVAEVSIAVRTSLRNADIAQMIKDAGSKLQYETLLHVLDQSDRKKLIAHVSALAPGQYTLQVVTRYAKSVLLKEPRIIEYDHLLTVLESQ